MRKRVVILGATGSIGCNALEVVSRLEGYSVVGISGNSQVDRLVKQLREYRPAIVGVSDEDAAVVVEKQCRELEVTVYRGTRGLVEMVTRDDVDVVVAAIVGRAGLEPVMAAVRAGKRVALANKESLVIAGELVMSEARKSGATIVPIDSEHSAIFQAMACGRLSEVKRVILTASGGPFRKSSVEDMRRARPEDAMSHPTWSMGAKISIDSATMFNKGLELIEACHLFGLRPEQIEIVIHPESVVHSMVEFVDGSVMAQLSPPDMRTPIQYALTWPDRVDGIGRRLDLAKAFSFHFEPPDVQKFPALRIAYEVANMGGSAGAVMNAANETAVSSFMSGNIAFDEISRVVELTIRQHRLQPKPTLDDLLEADRWARETAERIVEQDLIRK